MNGKGVKIYVSLSQADAFRNTLIDAAKKTAEASGAEIVVYDAENSIENQVAQIKQAVAEDYDAIMCGPVDADTALELEALADFYPEDIRQRVELLMRQQMRKYSYLITK